MCMAQTSIYWLKRPYADTYTDWNVHMLTRTLTETSICWHIHWLKRPYADTYTDWNVYADTYISHTLCSCSLCLWAGAGMTSSTTSRSLTSNYHRPTSIYHRPTSNYIVPLQTTSCHFKLSSCLFKLHRATSNYHRPTLNLIVLLQTSIWPSFCTYRYWTKQLFLSVSLVQ
jgi:hypothetical protein